MAERDGAAVDVELGRIGVQLLQPRRRDAREGLVHFELVDIAKEAGVDDVLASINRLEERTAAGKGV